MIADQVRRQHEVNDVVTAISVNLITGLTVASQRKEVGVEALQGYLHCRVAYRANAKLKPPEMVGCDLDSHLKQTVENCE